MTRLLFGISGLPLGDGKGKFKYATGIEYLSRIGLDAMELPFVRSVNVTDKNCAAIRGAAEANGICLSAHGSYFVNLNAAEPAIREKSLRRLKDAAAGIRKVGGRIVVFHPGYYLGMEGRQAAAAISGNLAELAGEGVNYCLETTGKPTQFGTVREIVALCERHSHCRICIDFAHVHARGNGALHGYEDFAAILRHVGERLGRAALDDLHMHVSGIEYTAKGELRHLPLRESDFDYAACLRALKDFSVGGRVICEDPLLERDALFLKNAYARL